MAAAAWQIDQGRLPNRGGFLGDDVDSGGEGDPRHEGTIVHDGDLSLRSHCQASGESVGRMGQSHVLSPEGGVGHLGRTHRVRESHLVIEPLVEVGMGDGDDPRIGLTGAQGQRQAHRGRPPDNYAFIGSVTIPEQSDSQLAGALGSGVSTPDDEVELGSIGNDTKATTAGRSDHDDLFD